MKGSSPERKALGWIRRHTLPDQGVMVSSRESSPYLQVTGYLIPTLLTWKEPGLARQYAEFLRYMQRPDGAFCGPDGREYPFDTGQALRGLLAAAGPWPEYRDCARRAADFLVGAITPEGRLPAGYDGKIPEAVHLFICPALREAARVLDTPAYARAADQMLAYYKQQPDLLSDQVLTHFYAYILDGLVDMGEEDLARPAIQAVFRHQMPHGGIPAYPSVRWICSVGTAQMAIVGYKLGLDEEASRAVAYLCRRQNRSGGFYGSYGRLAAYFPEAEISWANKFFLDALSLRRSRSGHDFPKSEAKGADHKKVLLDAEQWHRAIVREAPTELAHKIRANRFPPWIQPLLTHTTAGDAILEVGSGTGELSAILALYGREVTLLDYSRESLDYAQRLFQELGISGVFCRGDMFDAFPVPEQGVDWVFGSGVLEHYTDQEIVSVLAKSARAARKGVMALVPNRQSLFYRIGKHRMEQDGQWPYGYEDPKRTLRPLFERAGLHRVDEYSVAPGHSLAFWGRDEEDVRSFFGSLDPGELRELNQGYLLFTYGCSDAG